MLPHASSPSDVPLEELTLRVRVDLLRMKPPVWRRLDLDADLDLESLHVVLQTVFGWDGDHLHLFAHPADAGRYDGGRLFADVTHELDGAEPEHETTVGELLRSPGDTLGYTYDLGDDWQHAVALEKVLPRDPESLPAVLVTGRQSAPYEDGMGLYDEDGELLDKPLERPFDLDALKDAVANLFEDNDDDNDLLDEELLERIFTTPAADVAAAARANALVSRLRAGLGVDGRAPEDLPSAQQAPWLLSDHRSLIASRDAAALSRLTAPPPGTPERELLDTSLRAVDDDGVAAAASLVLAAYVVGVLEEYTGVEALTLDLEESVEFEGGRQALAALELVMALAANATVLLPELAETSLHPTTVLHEGVLLAGAGLGTLTDGVLDMDPALRPALLTATSVVAGGPASPMD